jgi:RND superfamily putative drug exporter
MYDKLGSFISRRWKLVILFWVAVAVAIWSVAPSWDEVSKDGDLAYLPARMTSVRGQKLYGEAFPNNKSRSEVVVVIERPEGLVQADLDFLHEVADVFEAEKAAFASATAEGKSLPKDRMSVVDVTRPASNLIGRVDHGADDLIGQKLISKDKQAAIVVASLEHELIAVNSARMMKRLARGENGGPPLLEEMFQAAQQRAVSPLPPGAIWGITGSASIGGDTLIESDHSIEAIHLTTGVLVVIILLVVYQAPVMVIVPLVTIGVAVFLANNLIAMLTQLHTVPGFGWWEFQIFKTSKIFIFTICFGSGTDFCLFLISRYKEEMEKGYDKARGLKEALGSVGEALVGSALTTVCGLGMMYFADFGKFSYSGPAIAMCLIVTLLGCLTLAPAMLRALGHTVFWPFGVKTQTQAEHDAAVGASKLGRFWTWTSDRIMARPGLIMFCSLLLMAPLAYEGLHVTISYDLLSDLQPDVYSRRGTAMMERHFEPGEMGPISILVSKDGYDFQSTEGRNHITELAKEFYAAFPDRIDAVRCLTWPLGDQPRRLSFREQLEKKTISNHKKSEAKYVSTTGPRAGQVTRFDIVSAYDPFSLDAQNLLGPLDPKLRETTMHLEKFAAEKAANDPFWKGATFDFIGTTAGTRDLKAVVTSDEVLIQQLVVIAVSGVVLFILRRPLICTYLIFTVVFSYLVTIGATELVFSSLYADFTGLDWKVPIFLFVILVAVGEDYNIYLATRVFEEERRLGRLPGLRMAIIKTGGIITSCGVIMAGTFVSLMSGTLRALHALGFALTLGVILDTFIVRPILVPAFLAWLYRFTPEKTAKAFKPDELEEDAAIVGGPLLESMAIPAKPHTEMTRRSVKR